MGACIGTKDSQTKITLKHLIMRLRTTVPLQKSKLSRNLQKQQILLTQQFIKQKKSRSKSIQQSLLQQIVFIQNTIQIWSITDNCCVKVLDYYAVLQDAENIKHISTQLQTLLYMNSIINNQDLSQIYKIVTTKYKIKEPKEINNEIANYHKKSNSPNEKMRNDYIMNMCLNKQWNLEKINQVGHGFRYGVW